MHEYETVFILDPGLDEHQVNEEVEKAQKLITANGGRILDVERWGRKRLAYEIRKKRDGVYTLLKHESTGDVVKELERRLRLNDSVMRVMTVIAGPEWEAPAEGEGEMGTGIARRIPAAPSAAPAPTEGGLAGAMLTRQEELPETGPSSVGPSSAGLPGASPAIVEEAE